MNLSIEFASPPAPDAQDLRIQELEAENARLKKECEGWMEVFRKMSADDRRARERMDELQKLMDTMCNECPYRPMKKGA